MAEQEQTKIVIALVVYFVLLTVIFYMVSSVTSEFGLGNDVISSSGGTDLGFTQLNEFGSTPRFPGNSRFRDHRDITPDPLIRNGIITDENTCEYFQGFSWITKRSILHWFTGGFLGSEIETCDGRLDFTYYNDGVPQIIEPGSEPSPNTKYLVQSNITVCDLSMVSRSEEMTDMFGCTWYTIEMLEEIQLTKGVSTFSNIWETIKQVATLRININTDYSIINGVLALLLVWIPFTVLIISAIQIVRRLIGFT